MRVLTVTFFLMLIFACCSKGQSSEVAELNTVGDVLEKYDIQFGRPRKDSEFVKATTAIPFLKNGKYLISDYNGKILSNVEFDRIETGFQIPFVIGTIDSKDYIYNIDGTKAHDNFFSNLKIYNFKPSKFLGVKDLYIQGSDTIHLTVDNAELYESYYRAFYDRLSSITERHEDKVRKIRETLKDGISDPRTNLKIPKSQLQIHSNAFGNWVLVRNEVIHGLLDTEGNWIYPLDKRKMRLYHLSLPHNGGTLEITDGKYKFVINQDYQIIEQGIGFELIKPTGLGLEGIPVEYRVEDPDYEICPNIEEYIQLRDQKWTHFFDLSGTYLRSFRGINAGAYRYPANSEVREFSFYIGNRKVTYYARVSDGFIYSSEEINSM